MKDDREIADKKPTGKRPYHTPELKQYGDLRELSKGQYAFSIAEGIYEEMIPPT